MSRRRTDRYGSSYNTASGARKAPPIQNTVIMPPAAAGTTSSSSYYGSSFYANTNTNVPSFATNTNVPSFATTTTNRNNNNMPSRTTTTNNASTNNSRRRDPSLTKKTTDLTPKEERKLIYALNKAYTQIFTVIDTNTFLSEEDKMGYVEDLDYKFGNALRYYYDKNNATEMQRFIDKANNRGGCGGGCGGCGVPDDATVATTQTAMDMSKGI